MSKDGEAMVPELGLSWQVEEIDELNKDFSTVVWQRGGKVGTGQVTGRYGDRGSK